MSDQPIRNAEFVQHPHGRVVITWWDAKDLLLKQCRCGGAQIEVDPDFIGQPVYCGEAGCEIPKRVAYSEEIRKGHMIVLNVEMNRPSVTPKEHVLLKG